MADVFTIEAHPSDASLVIYKFTKDGTVVWADPLPANDFRGSINRAFPVTDLRDGQPVTFAPGKAEIADTNRGTIEAKLDAALAANATFLAIASPTAAQVRDQTVKLTREATALIKLVRKSLADTAGT